MTKTQVEVIDSARRRRRWSRAEKERIVAAAMEPGAVASAVAREAGNSSEPAVSLAPATAWGCGGPVCIVNVRGPTRCCTVNRLADIAGSDRSRVCDRNAAADLRACGHSHRISGHAGPGRLRATLTRSWSA